MKRKFKYFIAFECYGYKFQFRGNTFVRLTFKIKNTKDIKEIEEYIEKRLLEQGYTNIDKTLIISITEV